ncbi:MAG: sulfatase-like hydrolase/transferase [bacterium]
MKKHSFEDSLMQWSNIVQGRIRRKARGALVYGANVRAFRRRRGVAGRIIADTGLSKPRGAASKHILFIVIDCLRRDHLSLHGYHRETTPFLDSVASGNSVFQNAISPSPWTYSSVASMLTGLYPHSHGGVFAEELRNFSKQMMPRAVRENVLFLPEILHHFGFATYIGSAITTAELPLRGRFQHINASAFGSAGEILQKYVQWLQKRKSENTFSYLQLGDLHAPVHAPEPQRSAFGTIPGIPRLERWDYLENAIPGEPGFERYRENRIKLYDSALLYVDSRLRSLFGRLTEMKVVDDMMIVITADHGEEMWDHFRVEKEHFFDPRSFYGAGHGHHLWQEIIGVPLIAVGGDIPGREIHETVSTVDLAPAVLEYCGIKGWEKMEFDGRSVFAATPGRAVLSEDISYGYEKKAVLEGKYKLYYSKGDGVKWVFDLEKDPGEERPLELPEVADRLGAMLPEEPDELGGEVPLDGETASRLRHLGYID